ncbi:hypothetical protein [Cellulomonas sp. Y8]|uniref:hypothetical protein n=1 Tax=Cellulomonas sp. Y8 TaxID=2591145 RepID=UPI00143D9F87|nr:hypothetical protein [Cellulomonas sp. Y8]
MSGTGRRPDNGVPGVCDSAAEQVRGICTDLAGAASTASSLAPTVRTAWQGQAGNAFCSSLDAATESSRLTVAAWDRVKDELVRYATRLRDIQARGDQIRSALSSAEGSLSTAKKTLARYDKDDDTAAWRITHARGTVASLTDDIATQTVALDNLRAERQALDNDVAAALHSAPGAGAAAWQAIAYRNGRTIPKTDILDELLDLLDRDPTGNLDLLHQFLLMHSNDAELMGTFFDGLGARGLLRLMGHASGVSGNDDTSHLVGLLAGAFASASRAWSADDQQRFGFHLVRELRTEGLPDWLRVPEPVLLSVLLTAPGVGPHIGLGVFEGLELMRRIDPTRFAAVTAVPQNVPFDQFHDQQSLANASFMLMSQIPSDTLAFLASSGNFNRTLEYWYGEHPWAGGEIPWTIDGFGGPAALMNAIISDPTIRTHDASDLNWATALDFLSRAVNGLGRNPGFEAHNVSAPAALHLASSLAIVIPEIVARLDPRNASSLEQAPADALVGREIITVLGLDITKGALNRVLGVSLLDNDARDTFARAMADYLSDSAAQAASQRTDVITGTGRLYGLAYGALAGETSRIESNASAAAQAARDMFETILSWIPMPGTGGSITGYLVQIGTAVATDSIADQIHGTKTWAEIQDASISQREAAGRDLQRIALVYFEDHGIDESSAAELAAKLAEAFDIDSNASSNPAGSGGYATN